MQWQVIVALAVAVPLFVLPAAFVWYLVVGGSYVAARPHLGAVARRVGHAALFSLIGILFPVLIWVGLGIAVNRWVREKAVSQPREARVT